MSDAYTKLFSSITESTIWGEPAGTRLVWITMLAKCNRHGEVYGSVPGLARLANVSLDECDEAIQTLLSPDKWSRTPDNEGRRIAPIDGGWRILNHAKFDRLRSEIEAEERERERKREWDRRHRNDRPNAKYRTPDEPPTTPDAPPTQSDAPPTPSVSKSERETRAGADDGLPSCVDPSRWSAFREQLEHDGKQSAPRILLALGQLRAIAKSGGDCNAVLEAAVMRGFRDLADTHRRLQAEASANGARAGPQQRVGRQVEGLNKLEEMIRERGETDLEAHATPDARRLRGPAIG